MKKVYSVLLIIIMAGIFSTVSAEEKVARLDDEIITKSMLEEYVDNFLGEDYKKMLNSESGVKKLADFYINRQIILEKAKKTIKPDNELLKGHMNGEKENKKTENTMYITAFLKQEINDKLSLSKKEMQRYMKKHNIDSKREAEIKLSNEKRKKMFDELIEELRAEHTIKYF
jgi:di/tripeptidase